MLTVVRNTARFILAIPKRLRRFTKNTPTKLHLGCGSTHIEGYCNVDIIPNEFVDIVDNVARLRRFKQNSIEQIYACHVLEHFSHEHVKVVLSRWFAVLKPGGELRISVPDLDKIVTIYKKNWKHFQTKGNSPWIGLIYGGQTTKYDFHKTGFNFCWLSLLLSEAGFENISSYNSEPHFIEGLADNSAANEPFGEYISLNVTARKPQ